ncbi:N-acetylglucosamine-6-phosphate deacetylase [Luteitalea sp. TBR-22]|uniref:N-acetylglucosamine-6-phosphate deacetylase n=1 Tax=Luteitalea sp. TBR-22 TaxID=2802971 RepID=UPI001AFCB8EB|nr:amidohydrolase family protein [Luteitalea sp. TBR-22]BCS35038.1 N-acetylglucosamine-6-phosphate deacetylase [Luteitalea sp. TBR-22]
MPAADCLVIENATAILPDRLLPRARVVIEDGRIARVGGAATRVPRGARTLDARGGYAAPGFVDVHVHGGGGADFMDGTADAVRTACATHARHGTTTIFPTTTTGSPQEIARMIAACRAVRDQDGASAGPPRGARIAGIHLYGPFFAPDKVGCHSEAGRRDPTRAEFARYFATGMVRIATCAAELPGADRFFRQAAREGCLVTCGHSNASWAEMARAFAAGMRHVDHFWCAMSSVASVRARLGTPMQGSMEQYVLVNEDMSTEVIADGQHLAPELLRFAHRMLGPRRLLLVTDASRAVDMPPGRYRFGHAGTGTDFEHDGRVGRAPGGGLASSSMGMDHMVRTMAAATKAPLWDVVRMASLTPAERTGLADEIGSLAPGKRADVLVLSPRLKVRQVVIGGGVLSPVAAGA